MTETQGTLYLVATPIGHARDITLRALDCLHSAAVIACEDTRRTRKLLALHGVTTPLSPYHDHNATRAQPRLLRRLENGEDVALVSDAGTPLVCDPGYGLVRVCLQRGVHVTVIPGPSAVLAALALSGLPPQPFFFAGFLPRNASARKRALMKLRAMEATLIVFESARRLAASLTDMNDVLGPRPASSLRELTKLYEEAKRGTLASLAADAQSRPPPRGECVIVVAPPQEQEKQEREKESMAAMDDALRRAMGNMGHVRLRSAVDSVQAQTGLRRRALYARALALRKGEKR